MRHLELSSFALGYLLGSFPTGYLVGRHYGIDIRTKGSGNIGATNVARVLGRIPGLLVFGCDLLKGLLAVRLVYILFNLDRHFVTDYYSPVSDTTVRAAEGLLSLTHTPAQATGLGILAALACIIGHNFPVWLDFRGGKGIATSTGALLGLMPMAVVVSVIIWAGAFIALRYVSVASLLAAATLPLTVAVLWHGRRADATLFGFSLIAAALAFWRHRGNIRRLREGTEPRFAAKSSAPKAG